MRQFIRHPTEIPIEFQLVNSDISLRNQLKNISAGGLCFRVLDRLEPGDVIHIYIGSGPHRFTATGQVIWCRKADGHYDIGVKFADEAAEYGVRMAEQVCHIQQYKQEMLEQQGRKLTDKEAADEWIEKFADRFPA